MLSFNSIENIGNAGNANTKSSPCIGGIKQKVSVQGKMEQDGAESQFTQQAVTHSRLRTEDDTIVL